MAEGIVGMVVFTVVLGCSWLASKSVSDAVKAHGPSSFDRALGLTFGLVRGFLIIVIMLIVNATLYQSVAIKPGAWRLRNYAYSYPIVKSAGEGLIRRAVPYLPSRIAGPASRVRL